MVYRTCNTSVLSLNSGSVPNSVVALLIDVCRVLSSTSCTSHGCVSCTVFHRTNSTFTALQSAVQTLRDLTDKYGKHTRIKMHLNSLLHITTTSVTANPKHSSFCLELASFPGCS